MSKLSQLHAELSEQAYELGFENLEEALANGYEVDYDEKELVNPYVLSNKAHEEAHKAWLKERDILCHELEMLVSDTPYQAYKETLTKAVNFLRKECHD